jgi:hypothetical protein
MISSLERAATSVPRAFPSSDLQLDLADLDHGLDPGVVGDVAHDLVGVRAERALEVLDGVEQQVPNSRVGCQLAGGAPATPSSTDMPLIAGLQRSCTNGMCVFT